MQLAEDRHPRKRAQRRLVRRSQMVQVEQVGPRGAGAGKRARPGRDQTLVGGIVDHREHAIGAPRPILIGRLEGDSGSERVREPERGRVVDWRDLDARIEAGGVGRLARLAERAGRERDLPAADRQSTGERPRDLRGAAAGKEKQRRAHATAPAERVPACACTRKQPTRPDHGGYLPRRRGQQPRHARLCCLIAVES